MQFINKKVKEVEGWTLSDDGMTLTKEYSENAEETVDLVDYDGKTASVTIKISNIQEDDATLPGSLPAVSSITDSGKWFVPSKLEWSAFGDYLYTKIGISGDTCEDYDLDTNDYWCSSVQKGAWWELFEADVYHGRIEFNYVDVCGYALVRFCATF